MEFIRIGNENLDECQELFKIAFLEDKYYKKAGYNLLAEFPDDFRTRIEVCLSSGKSIGIRNESNELVALAIVFDYRDTLLHSRASFDKIFGIMCNGMIIPYNNELHKPIAMLMEQKIVFIMSIAVRPEYRRKHLGTKMVDYIINNNPDAAIVGGISAMESMPIYRNLGFKEHRIEDDYILVIRHPVSQI